MKIDSAATGGGGGGWWEERYFHLKWRGIWDVRTLRKGGGVQPASQNLHPIYDQHLQFTLPYYQ